MKNNKIYKLIDANFNRANEGLRVIEEYYRFINPDSETQKLFKNIRHSLYKNINKLFGYYNLLQNRNTKDDQGSKYSIETESSKSAVNEILISNFKRVQESMRVIEEYSKLINPEYSFVFKKIRFQIYDIEQIIWR
jgi:thiamine-phosphate pyrophosphorylase